MYKIKYLSPMIPSYDFDVTGKFFEDVMGFRNVYKSDIYLIYEKDNLTVHILRAGEDIGEMEFYIEVDNVDSFWDGIKDKVIGLKFREPFDREYKMREAHIIIPATKCLMFIGQSLE